MQNILLCQDLVKQYSRKGTAPSCLLKIDLCKAYDTMDWVFLKEMLVALNFPHHFVRIIMACIFSTSYVSMINGCPLNIIKANRGLRQGDPLSSLPFVLGMKYRSHILKSMEGSYGFHPRCRKLRLTHLCFVDDLMLFCKGDTSSVRLLYQCIHFFSRTSGLQANSSK